MEVGFEAVLLRCSAAAASTPLHSSGSLSSTEKVRFEVAARLSDARSKLNVATSTSMKLHERAALEKSWLREHTHVRLTGDSEEHKKLRLLLDDLGPQG